MEQQIEIARRLQHMEDSIINLTNKIEQSMAHLSEIVETKIDNQTALSNDSFKRIWEAHDDLKDNCKEHSKVLNSLKDRVLELENLPGKTLMHYVERFVMVVVGAMAVGLVALVVKVFGG